MADWPTSSGLDSNRDERVRIVLHSELKRSSDSSFKKECPVCREGMLLMNRNMDGMLMPDDACTWCCQRFWYADIATPPGLLTVLGEREGVR